ncbi:MAG TPA: hypothetical protein VKA60_09230 [Blastocatellia bacterium]|nr:hypothetical protein [Blastocatellia bacterium]
MQPQTATQQLGEQAIKKLLRWCRGESWMGYDPYDGLNSPVARFWPMRNRLARTALTQLVKRSPVNLRPLLGIRKAANPKGLALAARAVLLLAQRENESLPADLLADAAPTTPMLSHSRDSLANDFRALATKLEELRSAGYEEACWGYNFDWQSRAFFAPRGTPNTVCTTFAAHAFLDWHELSGSNAALQLGDSSCRFLLDRLKRTASGEAFCFSYTPLDASQVHNVNLLAAELLARAFHLTGRDEYRDACEHAVRYTLDRQRSDGSWPYGEAPSQQWVDGFHTGFIIVSLKRIIAHLERPEWTAALGAAYEFYDSRFFLADGTPAYYDKSLFPVDVHSAAQAIVTFTELIDLMPNASQRAARAVEWAIRNLQDSAGFFYFQRHRFYTIRTAHIRWAQAWMLYALGLYLSRTS